MTEAFSHDENRKTASLTPWGQASGFAVWGRIMQQQRHSTKIARMYLLVVVVLMLLVAAPAPATDRSSEIVFFNVQTHKVHKMHCVSAQKCTKNCIAIKRAEAYRRGGIPCKVCGG